MKLKNKTAVITGAGGGIGSALVERLNKEGVNLILIDKEFSLLEHLDDVIDEPNNGYWGHYTADLSRPMEVMGLASRISKDVEKIDLLFNIAGIGIYKPIEELQVDEWQDSMNINVTAPFILTKKLMPSLKKSEDPLVVNIGSRVGAVATKDMVAYCASKFGLRGMSLSLSNEKSKIKYCYLRLGSVMTPFGSGGLERRKELESKGKKYLTPEDVAKKIIEITKDKNREDEVVFYPKGYEEE